MGASSDNMTLLADWFSDQHKAESASGSGEAHNSMWIFRRAANLIRESLELSGDAGVIFLENGSGPLAANPEQQVFPIDKSDARVLAMSTLSEPFNP
jgi:hypothetical protein